MATERRLLRFRGLSALPDSTASATSTAKSASGVASGGGAGGGAALGVAAEGRTEGGWAADIPGGAAMRSDDAMGAGASLGPDAVCSRNGDGVLTPGGTASRTGASGDGDVADRDGGTASRTAGPGGGGGAAPSAGDAGRPEIRPGTWAAGCQRCQTALRTRVSARTVPAETAARNSSGDKGPTGRSPSSQNHESLGVEAISRSTPVAHNPPSLGQFL